MKRGKVGQATRAFASQGQVSGLGVFERLSFEREAGGGGVGGAALTVICVSCSSSGQNYFTMVGKLQRER